MNEFRVSVKTPDGERWFIVEANTPESARTEAEGATAHAITKIEADWADELDPKSHIDC
jgi:hypothetical protein